MERAYKLKKEYSESGIPTVIADEDLNILWKNNIGGFPAAVGESAVAFFDGGVPETGLTVKKTDDTIMTFNVIKTEDADNNNSYYIIELIGSRKAGGTVSAEAVRGYIGYVCSKLRTALNGITAVTDRLSEYISSGGLNAESISAGFEQISESTAMLEREVFYPDRIYSMTAPENPDDTIILEKEMAAVVSGIKSFLDEKSRGRVRISEDYDRDIFFRMNADSFETAVASMTAECCGSGGYPERIIFSARHYGRNRAEITAMSLNISAEANRPPVHETERDFNRKLLSEYVYDVLGLKNGARFSKENIPNGIVCRMNIEAFTRGVSVFAEKPVDGSGRQSGIMYKLAFFFGDIPDSERHRYMSPDFFEEDEKSCGEPKGRDEAVQNVK